jgi:hypothetical protein
MANGLVSCINANACPAIHATVIATGSSVTCFNLIGPDVTAATANICVGPAGSPATCCTPLFTPQNPNGCQFNPGVYQIPDSGQDCNDNGIDDAIDIFDGTSADADGNGIPDECMPPPVPTVSEWGLVLMTLIGLTAGTVIYRRPQYSGA